MSLNDWKSSNIARISQQYIIFRPNYERNQHPTMENTIDVK